RRYNGSGPAAERYAADAMARLGLWAARLGGTAGAGVLLRRGSRGPAVEALQLALNRSRGERLAVDGVFGPATEAAVRRAQAAARIAVDGIVGPQTRAVLGL